jgi:glycosyltransferase involved in cell wall biosynthesis
MKILFITPGSGDSFYCGNCFRDNLHAASLRRAGHSVVVMPLYLPLNHDSFRADTPLFFPAISLYVAQKYFRTRDMPQWLERALNSERSLRMAASFSGSTSSEGLEGMTLSMINGDDPIFIRHASTLVDWIKNHERPDVIHLSSSLVIGIAMMIKREINIPIVCSLQDEEIWINALGSDAHEAWQGIAAQMRFVDRFVTSSMFYREAALGRFPGIAGRIEVVYPGLNLDHYSSDHYPDAPTIGFFYRMNEPDGLHILAKAFAEVKRSQRVPGLRLRIGGGFSGADKAFLRKVNKTLSPFKADVDRLDAYSLGDHAAFYRETTVVSVPVTFNEGVGLYVCEAFAAGRPVIEPATGSFPEIVAGGGLLYAENTVSLLAEAIVRMFAEKGLWNELRLNAIELARTRYGDEAQADSLSRIYKAIARQ